MADLRIFFLVDCLYNCKIVDIIQIVLSCLILISILIALIFQVFGTDVMVTVAKSFEAPIKCKLIQIIPGARCLILFVFLTAEEYSSLEGCACSSYLHSRMSSRCLESFCFLLFKVIP